MTAATVNARLIRYPAVSPDGKRVAFTAFSKLYVMDLAGGTPETCDNRQRRRVHACVVAGRPKYCVCHVVEQGRAYLFGSGRRRKCAAVDHLGRILFFIRRIRRIVSKIVFITGAVDDQLFADIREGHEYSSPEEEILHGKHEGQREVTGIGGNTGTDLRYIPASGGASVHIAPTQGGRLAAFFG